MKCPDCGLIVPQAAYDCECGHDFKPGVPRAANTGASVGPAASFPLSQGVKLYSSINIVGSTFFGGPLAAGYLLSKNFKNLGDGDAARTSLLIAIGVTILLTELYT